VFLSLVLAASLLWAHLPAALLLGPMIAGIIIGTSGGGLRVGKLPHEFAQATIGCLIARAITPEIVSRFSVEWPLFVGMGTAIIFISCVIGAVFSKMKLMPGTSAVWGLLPGAASAMMIMSESFGADSRIVAFMQYLRVVCVSAIASTISLIWVDTSHSKPPSIVWFSPIHIEAFALSLALILLGILAGRRSRLPAGTLLLPMVAGGFAHVFGMAIDLPQWFLAVAYAFLGWSVGLRFTPEVVKHAAKVLPQTALAILLMVTFCAGLAFILVQALHVDPLTAYLATSPGGMDSIAIIAATSKVDISFVMAMQMMRFLVVLALGPPASKFVASRMLQPAIAPKAASGGTANSISSSAVLDQAKEDESELD
jgi:membrane AbrB-like protein